MTADLLELVFHNSSTAIAVLRGPGLVIERANPACQALWPGGQLVGRMVADVWPEATPFLLHRVDGQAVELLERRYFDLSCVPFANEGVLLMASEVTAQKRMEELLHSACAELAAIHANAPVAFFVIDDRLRVEKVNDLAARFSGKPLGETMGRKPGEAVGCLSALANAEGCGRGPGCAYCAIRAAVIDSLSTGARYEGVEAWLSRSVDGTNEESCLLISTSAMEFGHARKVLVCAQDITGQKRTQIALESALAEKTILLKEVHHRVKNNLAVISSLLSMKADAIVNLTAKEALRSSQQRVHSMALIHEHLYGNERLDRINFADYATELVRRLHAAAASEPDRIAIALALDPIELAIEQAVPCGLILNELLTNAFKYAFRGRRRRGRIAISFRESGGGLCELSVEDNGVGIPADRGSEASGNSLGLRIVEVLTRQLDGALEYTPCSGTRVVLRFPVGKAPRVGDNRPQCAR